MHFSRRGVILFTVIYDSDLAVTEIVIRFALPIKISKSSWNLVPEHDLSSLSCVSPSMSAATQRQRRYQGESGADEGCQRMF
jgi:hypothetical protein